jgi:hypothetical protein
MDLIDTLGTKMSETEPKKQPIVTEPQIERGTSLLDGGKVDKGSGGQVNAQTSTPVEPSTDTAKNSQTDWTVESALKEVKKLREENKHTRLKYEEQVESLKKDLDVRVQNIEEKYKPAMTAVQELEELKKKEEDKKRDLGEKLAHRETLVKEYSSKLEATQKSYEAKVAEMEAKVNRFEAEQRAQAEVYQSRLAEELKTIPEQFKNMAELMVKGAGDPRDALVVIAEAKIKGLFEDKTVVVNHSVPGAHQGARMTKEQWDEKQKTEFDHMTGQQKIGAALKNLRENGTNTAFPNFKKR